MTQSVANHSIERFLTDNLRDSEYNGFFTALDGDKEIICDDKQLEDQALSILSLCQSSEREHLHDEIKELVSVFGYMKDKEYIGFIELTDRFWQPHGPGWVRTPAVQVLTAWALLEAADVLKDENLLKDGYKLLETCSIFYIKNGFPRRLSRDWEEIIDYRRDLKTVAYTMLALEKAYSISNNSLYQGLLEEMVVELNNFVDFEYGGAYTMLSGDGKPWKSAGKQTESMSLAIYAITKVQYLINDKSLLSFAEDMLIFILKYMKHPSLGGYWNKANIDGMVKVEAVQAYYNNDFSPFPIKLISDQALLLLAISQLNLHIEQKYQAVIKDLAQEIYKFVDRNNGGIFLGQGNFFSTPLDPTAPLIRHIMVPQHTPGAFHAGNTAYVPLHQKQAKTQSLVLLAMSLAKKNDVDVFGLTEDLKYQTVQLEKTPIKHELTTIAEPIKELKLNIPKYLEWSRSTKAGPAYGLTAYRSPLGFRSDTSNQNFSAMHVLSDLAVLDMEIEGAELLADSIFSSQNPDGGFGEQPNHPSEVFTTYCVIISAFIVKQPLPNKEKCIAYLKSCQNSDGGFGNAPGFPSDVWHTNLGVLALHVLGVEPDDMDACIAYVCACQKEDGSYAVQPGSISDTFSTFRAVGTLVALGKQPPNSNKTIKWLQDCQTDQGGFLYKPGYSDTMSFVGSYCAIAALYMLGELPPDVEKCKEWIANHQGPDGGFSRVEGTPSDTTDEGFISIQASYMLERSLNPYWVAIIT